MWIQWSGMYLIVAVMCLAGSAFCQEPLPPVFRLPTSITPVKYLLHIEPDMNSKTVSGTVIIEFTTSSNQSESLNSITMHLGLDVTVDEMKVALLDSSGVNVPIGAVEYDDANTLIKVILPDGATLQHNQMYMISFQFISPLYSEPNGLFTGSYNATSQYVASYFRPTYARNLFPCFDEPQYKVFLTLQVLRPATYSAVSTAPLLNSSDPDANNMVLDTFESTGQISLHSLGLFISNVVPVQAMNLTLYAPTGTPTSVAYLNTLLLNLYNAVGDLPTPGGRFYLVVLPDKLFTSFSSYGFVYTSPEVYLGQEPGQGKQFFLRLKLTEAFLQQYLEYKKTPAWWSDLWLSDSVGAFVALTLQPEFSDTKYRQWIKVEMRRNGFGPDFSGTTRPVVDDQLLSRWDIENAISSESIKYKGLNVLTMWNDEMPEGLVMKTIQDYVNLQNSTVTTNDFLELMVNNIKANTTYDVTPAIDWLPFWLSTTGYPVLSYQPYNDSMFTLSQSPSSPDVNSWTASMWPTWPISVSYAQNSSRDWTNYRWGLWLLDNSINITLQLDQWIVFNLETAPYRVNYGNSWDQIITALKMDLASSTNSTSDSKIAPDTIRAMIQEDAAALALSGSLSFPTMLSVVTNTQRNQADWLPLAKIFDAITAIIGDDQNAFTQLSMYAATLFPAEFLNSFDLRNSSANTQVKFIRPIVTPWLCKFNLGTCQEATVQLFQQLLQGNTTAGIDNEDIENVVCYGARYSTSVLNQLMSAYTNTTNNWLRYLYTIGLSCLTDPASVQTVLNTIVNSSSPFSASDASKIMTGLAGSVENSAALVNFIEAQPDTIQSKLGIGDLSATIKALGKFRVDLSKLESLSNVTLGLDPYVVQSVFSTLSSTNNSFRWWNTYGSSLEAALPLPNTTPPGTTKGSFTTPPPSSAKSLMNFQVFTLVITTVLTVITFNSC